MLHIEDRYGNPIGTKTADDLFNIVTLPLKILPQSNGCNPHYNK